MSDADHRKILELLSGYALNSLDAEDGELVRRHLAGCESCRLELASYDRVVDALALATREVEPSPALKDQLMQRVRPAAGPQAKRQPSPEMRPTSLSWRQSLDRALGNLLASPGRRLATLILFAVLAIANLFLWQRLNQPPGSEQAQGQVTLTGSELSPEARGIIYITADERNGTLIVEGLPSLGEAEQYQLWLIENGQRASGGVFSVNSGGYGTLQIEAERPFRDFSAYGVTIEPAGGSPGPTGDRVLGFNL